MPINFRQLADVRDAARPTDPIELFHSLRPTDPALNDLWLAQGDALRAWHGHRDEGDVAFVLDTGAGKTLVGLLAAQSLVNESSGRVVYACGSLQLVQQTCDKAQGYGLDTSTYIRGNFSNSLYHEGAAPCITTYQALFNGRSVFARDGGPIAIIFDDAHTAGHLLRDQFSLEIDRAKLPNLYDRVAALFRTYHRNMGSAVGYEETIHQQGPVRLWFLPPFAVKEQLSELQRLLMEADLTEQTSTMFAWEYLRNRIDLCAMFIDAHTITLTPPVVPVRSLPYFADGVRRVYLSATLAASDAFIRTFGRKPIVIQPETTAGKCERMILVPRLRDFQCDDVAETKEIIADEKALILVPSFKRANEWNDVAAVDRDASVTEKIDAFKATRSPEKLVLANRYDGIDLPGDMCRVLVIDELPVSVGPLESFLWNQLGLAKSLQSTVASRVVQSFGRISRGMSDHGVVLLTGERLVAWLATPRNTQALPTFLRKQFEIGKEISRGSAGIDDYKDVLRQCLDRSTDWIEYYDRNMADTAVTDGIDDEQAVAIAEAEAKFADLFWARDFATAAHALATRIDDTFKYSSATGAWHALWIGYCYSLSGDDDAAQPMYRRAHGAATSIPAPLPGQESAEGYGVQIANIAQLLVSAGRVRRDALDELDRTLAWITESASSNQVEEALRVLGVWLGLKATRPDNEFGTGPDALWEGEDVALCLEAKTDKAPGSSYSKADVGQMFDHLQWVQANANATTVAPCFVGPRLRPSPSANPGTEIVVVELSEFAALGRKLHAALSDVVANAVPPTIGASLRDIFAERGLLWPALIQALPMTRLCDLA